MNHMMSDQMDLETCYEWGNLFASPWSDLLDGMQTRAADMGFNQHAEGDQIFWTSGNDIRVKFCFIQDPSNIDAIRRVFNDDANTEIPVCFIVVKQPDLSDDRGDIIFDIFRMSEQSYLWHFYRVFTPSEK